MRDLEIRGAKYCWRSSMAILQVGFAAYCDMLERTIRKLKDGVEDGVPESIPPEISVDGYIPDDYIADPVTSFLSCTDALPT